MQKRLLKSLVPAAVVLAVGAQSAVAQTAPDNTLPNPTFAEGEWLLSYPWTSIGSDLAMGELMGDPAYNPQKWTISHVIGITGLGATAVGEKVDGPVEGSNGVRLFNAPNPFMSTQIVPAYLTLGTTWSTSSVAMNFFPSFEVVVNHSDGGVFDGIDFTGRPDGISIKIQRPETNEDKSMAIGYLWKGKYVQADVPGDIVMESVGPTTVVDMVDRDRNILGMETSEGGEVTKTDDAELIAKFIKDITVTTADGEWADQIFAFEYLNDATPEKLNLIFSAGDYFAKPEDVKEGNELTVANPRAIYFSRLQDLKINGTSVEGFESTKYFYHVTSLPALSEIKAVAMDVQGEQLTVSEPVLSDDGHSITITVIGTNGEDYDGAYSHTYTIADYELVSIKADGAATVTLAGDKYSNAATATFANTDLTNGTLTLNKLVVDGIHFSNLTAPVTYTYDEDTNLYTFSATDCEVAINGTTRKVNIVGTADATTSELKFTAEVDGGVITFESGATPEQPVVGDFVSATHYPGKMVFTVTDGYNSAEKFTVYTTVSILKNATGDSYLRLPAMHFDQQQWARSSAVDPDEFVYNIDEITIPVNDDKNFRGEGTAVVNGKNYQLGVTGTADEAGNMSLSLTLANQADGVEIAGMFGNSDSSNAEKFEGALDIEMNGASLAQGAKATIMIEPSEDGNTAVFRLPNFSLEGIGNLGDIIVDNVEVTTIGDEREYYGKVDGMSLMGGAITADVVLNGTVDADGYADMVIDVKWGSMPINVHFYGERVNAPTTAIEGVEAETEGPSQWFDLRGVRVDGNNLTPGIYIERRADGSTRKVLVR